MQVDLAALFIKSSKDQVVLATVTGVVFVTIFLSACVSWLLGVAIVGWFVAGCTIAVLLLNRRDKVIVLCARLRAYFEIKAPTRRSANRCEVCGESKCPRHRAEPVREPWKEILVDAELDRAVDSFFSHILSAFIESWFTQLSSDQEFVLSLKRNLREALSRVVLKLKHLDVAELLTEKILPCAFAHFELVRRMVADGVPMDRLAKHFIASERAVHPALLNRAAELNYLRALAKWLVPRLCHNDDFDSLVFFSLVRELFSGWALLPLMDVIADPNLINLLVIVTTNKPSKTLRPLSSEPRVVFLERFVAKKGEVSPSSSSRRQEPVASTNILTDQNQLYAFMQFLKKEGAVDVLRFYLDVDGLNADLLDPKVTTDPTKLSALHQQSEKLLASYQAMSVGKLQPGEPMVQTLAEAHDRVRGELQGKWQTLFHKTPEYFRLVYGGREIREPDEMKDPDPQSGFKLSSKLKGALRSAVDGCPLEGTEVPTVWDTLSDDTASVGGESPGTGALPGTPNHNHTIYTSVTQKLRKERGQHLDQFIVDFMHSIELVPELGEDVAATSASSDKWGGAREVKMRRKTPPGRNLVFDDLFALKRVTAYPMIVEASRWPCHIQGPSKCLVFLLVHIVNAPLVVVRLVVALMKVSRSTVDHVIRMLINKLIMFGLYEPRLTMLITTLENHLFAAKQPDPGPVDLLDRQRQAKLRLERIRPGLSSVVDVLQSPPMNKQLMYSLMDVVLKEVFPELEPPSHPVAKHE